MKYLLSLVLLLAALSVQAQKVGVVLSGGGVKGLYHMGIIKALEENGVPVDYVAGTSMGAIVAGLYAIGYSPEEMINLALSDEVRTWVAGRIDSRYNYYFRRMDNTNAMLTSNLDFKQGRITPYIPLNIVSSNPIDVSFSEIFTPASALAHDNFDNLFVPFRCVATDFYNRKEVVFRNGNLGETIRASMAIPFVYPPVKYDTLLLYDGGMINNFPWEVMNSDFHPDVIIGGKCVAGAKNPDGSNPIDLVEAITMGRTDFNLPEGKGIIIEHIFNDVGLLDFSRGQYIIDKGYEDAMALMDSIKAMIPREVQQEEMSRRRKAYKDNLPEMIFDSLVITGLNSKQTAYMKKMFKPENKENVFDYAGFKSEYFKILSGGEVIGGFPHASYNDSTGYFTMHVDMRTKPSLRVKLGGNISSTSVNQAYVGLEYKIMDRSAHRARFDGNFGALHTSLSLGWRSDFYLYRPLFVDVTGHFSHYNYQKSSYRSLYSKYGFNESEEDFIAVSLGLSLGRSSVFQIKLHGGNNNYYYFDTPGFDPYGSEDKTKFRYYAAQAEIVRNNQNYPLYPTRGIVQSISAVYVSGREHFNAGDTYPFPGEVSYNSRRWIGARFMREEYFRLGRRFSFGYLLDGVYTTHPDFATTHATSFTSPAFTPTIYSKTLYIDQFRNSSYAAGGLMPSVEFNESFYLKTGGFIYVPGEYIEFRGGNAKIRYIFSSVLVYQTPIGPASLTVVNFDAGRKNWLISFNFGYTLFGKKSLFY